MLKVRLMGTKNDIKWFGKILQRNPKIEVTEFSDVYPNKGTQRFHLSLIHIWNARSDCPAASPQFHRWYGAPLLLSLPGVLR